MKKIGFGDYVSSSDKSLVTDGKKSTGVFGLNEGTITKFEYNPLGGKGGTEKDCLDVVITVGDKEFNTRFFDITRVYDKKGNLLTDEDSPEYIAFYNKEVTQLKATIQHIAGGFDIAEGVFEKLLKEANPSNFADYIKAVTNITKAKKKNDKIHVFLQYQWQIGQDNDRTFLELPKNMKGGRFIEPFVKPEGNWMETILDSGALIYVDEAGNEHPFKRSAGFMDGNKANQQTSAKSTKKTPMNTPLNIPEDTEEEDNWDI